MRIVLFGVSRDTPKSIGGGCKFGNQLAKDGKAARQKNKETGEIEVIKTGEPLSAKTIKNIHGIISKALNTAVNQGLIRENIAQRVTVPKVTKTEIEPLTEEQQKAFIKAIQEHRSRAWVCNIVFPVRNDREFL